MYQTEALHFGVMQFNAKRRPIETLVVRQDLAQDAVGFRFQPDMGGFALSAILSA
jgi:hypothetical protein